MAFEFLGMQGTILYAFIIGAILLANWKLSKKEFLKFIPVSRQGLGIIGILAMIYVGSATAWWGFGEEPLAVDDVTPTPTLGVTFTAKGTETDANLTFDSASSTFICNFYENKDDDSIWSIGDTAGTTGANITTLTFTVTLYRSDYKSDNGVTRITSTIPTFKGQAENASITYYPVTYDTVTGEYALAMTPSGGSALNESTFLTVGPGASKATSIVATLWSTGLAQMDNGMSKDILIHTAAQDFTLRLIKVGESAT